ncbi:MAG TPA: Uma2 family endonuclease [Gemmatimonadales bacterium]|nr:Uma2 family endonuclease [Gemmatimonadales bacterium]
MSTPPLLLTAEDVERISLPGKQVELVRGRLVVREPPGTWHGAIAANLAYYLSDFVRRQGLGHVFAQDTGFKIASDPDTVRAPDVAFIARERSALLRSRGYAAAAPDLLAEILSPEDRPAEVLSKVADWLAAGTKIVWVVDPERQETRVYRQDGSLAVLGRGDSLDGEDVLPGFTCPLSDVLA